MNSILIVARYASRFYAIYGEFQASLTFVYVKSVQHIHLLDSLNQFPCSRRRDLNYGCGALAGIRTRVKSQLIRHDKKSSYWGYSANAFSTVFSSSLIVALLSTFMVLFAFMEYLSRPSLNPAFCSFDKISFL